MLDLNTIRYGDCMDVMEDIDSDSVDCIVTDPPYGMSFMGKNWDKAVPSVAIWQECLRILKPGAFTFVMCIPRQDCLSHMIVNLGDAGYNVSFSSIYHTFASGFPKATSISKQIDKRVGVEQAIIGKKKLNPRDKKAYTPNTYHGLNNTSTFEKNANMNNITIPMTLTAKQFDGSYAGFQPKPAVEVIIVAMKPLEEKTYLDQVLKNGHGCTWLDDCRIPFESKTDKEKHIKGASSNRKEKLGHFQQSKNLVPDRINIKKGRFPANVICEDDVLNNNKITKSTGGISIRSKTETFKGTEGRKHFHYGDSGSFSRYFSLDAWFAKEQKRLESAPCWICGYTEEHGNYIDTDGRAYCDECLISGDYLDVHKLNIDALPKEARKTFPWLIVPKASKSEKNRGLKDESNRHPTVKNIKLMSWLITLGTREGDIVLDPFCGSGTTCIAAKTLGRQYIGIEKEEEYVAIARKRISAIPTSLNNYLNE